MRDTYPIRLKVDEPTLLARHRDLQDPDQLGLPSPRGMSTTVQLLVILVVSVPVAVFGVWLGGSSDDRAYRAPGDTAPVAPSAAPPAFEVPWPVLTTAPPSAPVTDSPSSQPGAGATAPTRPTAPTAPSPTTATPPPVVSRDAYSVIQAEGYNAQSGVLLEMTSDTGGGQNISHVDDGDWVRFDNVHFGGTPPIDFVARASSDAAGAISGLVEVCIDNVNNPPIGGFAIANTGGWRTVPGNVGAVTGTHTVYLRFTSDQPADFVNINWFHFRR